MSGSHLLIVFSFIGSDDLISKLIKLRYEKRDEFKLSGKRGSTHDAWM